MTAIWRLIVCLVILRRREFAAGSGPALRRLIAAPGCGKTTFCLLFLHALIKAESDSGRRRLHWLTAPTKQLVTEIVLVAGRLTNKNLFAPAGQTADGYERLWQHQQALCEETLAEDFQEIRRLKEECDQALDLVDRTNSAASYTGAIDALRAHFLANFRLHASDKMQEVLDTHAQTARLVICTTTYKLKYEAGEKLPMSRVARGADLGGHVSDEPDMVPFAASVASSGASAFLLAAYDPSQQMLAINERSKGRASDSHDHPIKEEHYDMWLEACASTHRLMETFRHGTRITSLLSEVFLSHSDLRPTRTHLTRQWMSSTAGGWTGRWQAHRLAAYLTGRCLPSCSAATCVSCSQHQPS